MFCLVLHEIMYKILLDFHCEIHEVTINYYVLTNALIL